MSNQRPSFAKRDREMRLKDKAKQKAERRSSKPDDPNRPKGPPMGEAFDPLAELNPVPVQAPAPQPSGPRPGGFNSRPPPPMRPGQRPGPTPNPASAAARQGLSSSPAPGGGAPAGATPNGGAPNGGAPNSGAPATPAPNAAPFGSRASAAAPAPANRPPPRRP